MSSICCLYMLFFFCLQHDFTLSIEDKPRVAVVGAGIGGTSAAYFLRELFGDGVDIDVIEKGQVGGRLALLKISDFYYNAGGTIIHPQNQYMVNFTDILGLKRDSQAEGGRLGIYDGEEVLFTTSDYSLVTLAKLVWRYGRDIYNIKGWVEEKVLSRMKRLYNLQAEGHAFSTVEDLLNAMDPSLVDWTKKSIKTLLQDEGFHDKFIDEFVMGAMRMNYGQTTEAQGLVGAVCMAGVEPGLWSVVGGNQRVPEGLLQKSGANFIQGEVTTVTLSDEGSPPTYQVDYKVHSSDDVKSKEYDIVILATPIYDGMTNIKFEDFQTNIKPVQDPFHLTVANYIEGQPNTSFFGIESIDSFPDTFFTCNDSVFFNAFGKQKPTESGVPKVPVYKAFSNKVLSADKLKELVPNISDLRVVEWMAYPHYASSIELPTFTMHEQMYHINAIEMAASAMEMSVISAKNVALLAYYRYNGMYDKIDEVLTKSDSQEKTEL